ncbi:choloylglycine hydrolase family protein [Pantoea ananatis]|uniref:choloylglycine hydrolase family protein n=1 Tax=Pantoea ananas TaxID=553 RepID=UPI002360D2D1|nr:choloylglycine hydrolase family protein [Pantoea ananatis]
MCTSITFKSLEGNSYLGRTQEYHILYRYTGIKTPRNFKVSSRLGAWDAMYSVMGIGFMENDSETIAHAVIDGINEFSLCGVTQYFSEFNRYTSVEKINEAKKTPILAEQFLFWVLSNCKNTYEVEEKILSIAIADIDSTGTEHGLPQHFMFTDLSGRTIVVEPSKELEFEVYENSIGVMTNNPPFPWHVTNLKNYTGLSIYNSDDTEFGNIKLLSSGKGSGFMGVPGDYTPASRFVRAAYLLKYSETVSSEKSINKAFHVLATTDIVKGCIELNYNKKTAFQYTHYTSVYDLKNRVLYVKLYENIAIQKIEFSDDNHEGIASYKLKKSQQYDNVN